MAHKWNMMRDLEILQERMNSLFGEVVQRRPRPDDAGEAEIEHADWHPAADVYETDKTYLVALDLPGINRDGLDVSIDEKRLTIRGERKSTAEETSQRRAERVFGRFVRSFTLPASVDREAITAEYKNGVLRLRLPKRLEQQPRRVEIKVS